MVASSMFPDLDSFLTSYHVSPTSGFLPTPCPDVSFKNFEFNIWLFTAKSIPKLLWSYPGEFRKQVDELPLLLFTESYDDIPQWRLAYVALSYIAQAYTLGAAVGKPTDGEKHDEEVLDYIPANVAIPLRHVASRLGIRPGLTYSAVCTWNWHSKYDIISWTAEDRLANLEPIFSFTGTAEEAYYVASHVILETTGGQALTFALDASHAVGQDDAESLESILRDLSSEVTKCKEEVGPLKDRLDPNIFRSRVKPYITGLGLSGPLTNGIFMRSSLEDPSKGEWIQMSGASAAQTCLLPAFDALLGINHSVESSYRHNDLLRLAIPACYVQFLDTLATFPRVSDFTATNKKNVGLSEAYSNALNALEAYWARHFSVFGPARESGFPDRVAPSVTERLGDVRPPAVVAPVA